mmetsp:Transcript_15280/g.39297  ORF Transcript_15280/g.39297 Transcript_15280/m.39297 type:complete len:450 (-) Transcript_15280:2032-3381(-)
MPPASLLILTFVTATDTSDRPLTAVDPQLEGHGPRSAGHALALASSRHLHSRGRGPALPEGRAILEGEPPRAAIDRRRHRRLRERPGVGTPHLRPHVGRRLSALALDTHRQHGRLGHGRCVRGRRVHGRRVHATHRGHPHGPQTGGTVGGRRQLARVASRHRRLPVRAVVRAVAPRADAHGHATTNLRIVHRPPAADPLALDRERGFPTTVVVPVALERRAPQPPSAAPQLPSAAPRPPSAAPRHGPPSLLLSAAAFRRLVRVPQPVQPLLPSFSGQPPCVAPRKCDALRLLPARCAPLLPWLSFPPLRAFSAPSPCAVVEAPFAGQTRPCAWRILPAAHPARGWRTAFGAPPSARDDPSRRVEQRAWPWTWPARLPCVLGAPSPVEGSPPSSWPAQCSQPCVLAPAAVVSAGRPASCCTLPGSCRSAQWASFRDRPGRASTAPDGPTR